MPNNEVKIEKSQEKALTEFLYSEELLKLQGMLGGFNIFEATGAVNRELRHSDYLAFLFDPNQTHGMGDKFLREFLVAYFNVYNLDNYPSMIEIGCNSYDSFLVYREWRNIDLLFVSDELKMVVAIENKIWSGEDPKQLTKYQNTIENTFKGYHYYYAFLTPTGIDSEHNENWQPISYHVIHKVLSNIIHRYKSLLSTSVRFSVEQYLQMLERHILDDSEIIRLCQLIYSKHKHALDLIFEHKPDKVAQIQGLIMDYFKDIPEDRNIELEKCNKSTVRFVYKDFDRYNLNITSDNPDTGLTRVLVFEIIIRIDSVRITVLMGPGQQAFRSGVYEYVKEHCKLLKGKQKVMSPKFSGLFSFNLIAKNKYDDIDDIDEIKSQLYKQLNSFFKNQYPTIISELEGFFQNCYPNIEHKLEKNLVD
ncbi:PD-(D/E)XK nuclease family protein [Vibrio parahaemolyticus]|uniref:PD-(D/E)XK nuclease family protein n=1 Tax=Vibrio parahaemolyticus TaxID=670 RepID=A0A9Q3YLT8_VIBPH|nr:PD-(D/E)XK nuclease family protein [Vibrio parahaemolyticus]EGQ9073001.1 hypothetical protein [Vibrio parahaemolyticus]EIO3215156.1 PD-(D/E)XK nuclease family protein [Vibrio parahaemolyticus]EJB8436473.1 PD-(D/E)XK nuclease family protein [Vibrio parahaemolyticus]EJB8450097.1 PD-(D/E)XK nuclease family protein [Vibrio parahaemolyticus]EJV0280249.1 PD-(D/E)XK nuclease family protein [Vibrio parahaemolyticus]